MWLQRDHFLIQLNGHYEGGTTGETFNASGKTDILIRVENKNVFIADTGADGLGPNTGKLLQNLQAEGITPGEIDTVILSHGHPDHIGGNTVSEGGPAFPNARFVMWKDEWDFWTSDLAELKDEEHVKELLVSFAHKNLPPIQGPLHLVDHDTEVVPGIKVIAAPGHTPGHMAVATD